MRKLLGAPHDKAGTHQGRYAAAVAEYRTHRREEPDRNWRAFLWLATVRPSIWERIDTHADRRRAVVDWEAIGRIGWSSGEWAMLELARALYLDAGQVDPGALASVSDDLWAAIVRAFELYRGSLPS